MGLPSEGPTIYTPFLWKGEGPKGGGWPALAVSKTFATSTKRGMHFAVSDMSL